jgi:hypothetical protein
MSVRSSASMETTMSDQLRDLLIDAALAVLAFPILVVGGALRVRRLLERVEVMRRGVKDCDFCGELVPLSRMATCPVCHWTTPGSLLTCRCGATFRAVPCPTCGGTNAV